MTSDTIAAIATPPGRGGIGIVRISGPGCRAVAGGVLGRVPEPRRAMYAPFKDSNGVQIDAGLALFFNAPYSFTGEDVLELHGHGGPVVMDMLLHCVAQLGARLARPGEFSERAFLNDKIDLAEAEAIADLIDSASQQAARCAIRTLQGEFSRHVNDLVESLMRLRTMVEATIDFPEEEIDFLSDGRIAANLAEIIELLRGTLQQARQGCLLRDGMTVVIAGRPNVGKSTLLNRLSGRDAAIVDARPGTTRDVLREMVSIDGLPVQLIDTAGLHDSRDGVEQEGIKRAWGEIEHADLILLVIDDQVGSGEQERDILLHLPTGISVTMVHNKIDLTGTEPGLVTGDFGPRIGLSAKCGTGLDVLYSHLKAKMGYQGAGEGVFMARRRHIDALESAEILLTAGRQQLLTHHAGELLAADLQQAQQELAKITGAFTSDDLLGRIFSSFCIGK